MYTQRSKYWPAYTWKIQTAYSSRIKGKVRYDFKIADTDFEKMYFYIFDKINGSFYHLARLKENETIAIQIGKDLSEIHLPGTEGMPGMIATPYEPILYEYESFLITIKSALDLMATLLAIGLNENTDTIILILDKLRSKNINPNSLEEKISMLLNKSKYQSLFNDYRNPLGKVKKSKRNFATHKGSLPIGTINIPINNPNASLLLSKVLDPNEPVPYLNFLKSEGLVDYCEKHFYTTCDLLIEILSLITNTQLEPGPKDSVYELRREKTNPM